MSRHLQPTTAAAFAPATLSNLGMGFDNLGLAVDAGGDTVRVSLEPGAPGVRIDAIIGADLPTDATTNTAAIAAAATLRAAGVGDDVGAAITLEKGLPIGSGLGSSAASSVAAAYATNLALGVPLRKMALMDPVLEAEQAVAGRHLDNVAPALLGGLILVRSVDPIDVVRLPVPGGLWAVIVSPAYPVLTRQARAALPDVVTLQDTVAHAGDLASFVAACFAGDLDLLSRCIRDRLAEPVRAAMVPGAEQALEAARAAGAIGASISGSGPTQFAFCRTRRSGEAIARAMCEAFEAAGVAATWTISPTDRPGVRTAPMPA
ncbi:MAG: homoserine kinase [Planctomycetota bacterium]